MTISRQAAETVGDLMTGDLVSLAPTDTVAEARALLAGSGLHAVPVIADGEALGVVTLSDCEERDGGDPLGDVASGPPVTIEVDASVADAARLMRAEHVHHLLVTEARSTETVGILSSFDLLYVLSG